MVDPLEENKNKVETAVTSLDDNYALTFKDISSNMAKTSKAFEISQDMARQLSDVMDLPIFEIDPKKIPTPSEVLDIFRSIPNIEALNAFISPIAAIKPIINPIVNNEKSELTISEALGKNSSEIVNELGKISAAEEEVIFNYDAYQLLYNLERFLRDLIHVRICVKYEKNIESKINSEDLKKWKERKEREEENIHIKKGYRLIDYSDFTDLKRVFMRGKNKNEFSDLFNDQKFRNFISKLDELDPIRKKVAHSRPLSKNEFERLRIYADDITKVLTQNKIASEIKESSGLIKAEDL